MLAASAVKRGKKAIDLKSMVDKAVGFASRDGFEVQASPLQGIG